MKLVVRFTIVMIALALLLNSANAQMEIRGHSLYNAQAFLRTAPHVGEAAPAFNVRTLSGDPVSLEDYRGKNVVVIKGSYT